MNYSRRGNNQAGPKGSIPFPRSGSDILRTRTVGPSETFVISWGVIRMYCFLSEVLAVSIIIFMLIRRLTASINTSNSSRWEIYYYFSEKEKKKKVKWTPVPRQRNGQPMESQSESSRQMVEKDFSPPLNERGSLSFLPWVWSWSSVWT